MSIMSVGSDDASEDSEIRRIMARLESPPDIAPQVAIDQGFEEESLLSGGDDDTCMPAHLLMPELDLSDCDGQEETTPRPPRAERLDGPRRLAPRLVFRPSARRDPGVFDHGFPTMFSGNTIPETEDDTDPTTSSASTTGAADTDRSPIMRFIEETNITQAHMSRTNLGIDSVLLTPNDDSVVPLNHFDPDERASALDSFTSTFASSEKVVAGGGIAPLKAYATSPRAKIWRSESIFPQGSCSDKKDGRASEVLRKLELECNTGSAFELASSTVSGPKSQDNKDAKGRKIPVLDMEIRLDDAYCETPRTFSPQLMASPVEPQAVLLPVVASPPKPSFQGLESKRPSDDATELSSLSRGIQQEVWRFDSPPPPPATSGDATTPPLVGGEAAFDQEESSPPPESFLRSAPFTTHVIKHQPSDLSDLSILSVLSDPFGKHEADEAQKHASSTRPPLSPMEDPNDSSSTVTTDWDENLSLKSPPKTPRRKSQRLALAMGGDEGKSRRAGRVQKKEAFSAARAAKHIYSAVLLAFSVWLVLGVCLTEKSRLSRDPHPLATFGLTWFLLLWLATMEGGQGCLIGLQRVEKENYASTHPMALRCTTLAHKGDNMERFIVGRQFLVFIVVFLTNMFKVMHAPNDELLDVFLSSGQFWSGAAIILTTITLGQLTAQVNAANCMLDFVNSRAMLFTTYVALLIENTGILHSAYLFQIAFSKLCNKPYETREKRTTAVQKISFWGRVCMSLVLLAYAFKITIGAMLDGKTTVWRCVPGSVSIVLFFLLMGFVGLFEALQIALFEVINMPEEYFADDKVAKANCILAFRGNNLQSVLIGRQICVTTGVFAIARLTTPTFQDEDAADLGVATGLVHFFNTGLLGAFVTTIVASLAWRIVAASFPLAFLSNPLMSRIIRLCLLLENSGICSASWVFGLFHKAVAGLRGDEVYLGDAVEESPKHAAGHELGRLTEVV